MTSAQTEVTTVVLYAHLASALINGDHSGLDDQGEKECAEAMTYCEGWRIVDVGEPFFGHPDTSGLPGEVAEYALLKVLR